MNDPTVPDRPDHPDFWLLSEILLAQDTAMDHGAELDDAVGRHIDLDSLSNVASNQAQVALDRLHPNSSVLPRRDIMVLMASGFMSGFIAGQTFQTRKDIDYQAAQFPWVVDHERPPTLPGELVEIVARFRSVEHAEKFIGILAETDPEGVDRGDYGVVGPSDDEPSPGETP